MDAPYVWLVPIFIPFAGEPGFPHDLSKIQKKELSGPHHLPHDFTYAGPIAHPA